MPLDGIYHSMMRYESLYEPKEEEGEESTLLLPRDCVPRR